MGCGCVAIWCRERISKIGEPILRSIYIIYYIIQAEGRRRKPYYMVSIEYVKGKVKALKRRIDSDV
jgi:hypothetical protein